MSGTITTSVFFPPGTSQIGDEPSGTISLITCAGPVTATIFSAAGVALMSISSPIAVDMPVDISYSGGPPTIKQTTPSSISISY